MGELQETRARMRELAFQIALHPERFDLPPETAAEIPNLLDAAPGALSDAAQRTLGLLRSAALGENVDWTKLPKTGIIWRKIGELDIDPPLPENQKSPLDALLETVERDFASGTTPDGQLSADAFEVLESQAVAARLELQLLGELAVRTRLVERTQTEMQELVDKARSVGVTWASIGKATGVAPQSAYRRWDRAGRERQAEYRRGLRTDDSTATPPSGD